MKSLYLRLCLIGLFLCSVLTNTAQTPEWINLHRGNTAFKAGDMSGAEKAYRQALKANARSARAAFNLGDVYLSKKDAQNALKYYEAAALQEKTRLVRAMAYHNMGYIHHVAQDYTRAIDYYKEALRNNPKDDDTRYNLVLCQQQKRQKDQQKQNKNANNKQQQQDKQGKNDKNSPESNQQQQSNARKERPEQQQSGISKENAEQLLNLSRQSEQQTRRKIDHAQQPRVKQLDKNW